MQGGQGGHQVCSNRRCCRRVPEPGRRVTRWGGQAGPSNTEAWKTIHVGVTRSWPIVDCRDTCILQRDGPAGRQGWWRQAGT